MPYAIRNRRTKKWWVGGDRYHPHRQITSDEIAYLHTTEDGAILNMISRGMTTRTYEIVKVKIVEVEE